MKLIRLPCGPLACVFPVEHDEVPSERGKESGVYRAFSGSVEADGESEHHAVQNLDDRVRKLSQAPPAMTELELSRGAANDVASLGRPGLADTTGRFERYSELDTQPAPASSSASR